MDKKITLIKGFDNCYTISNYGEIFRNGVQMTPVSNGNGYLQIKLRLNGKRYNKYVHRLVYENFVGEIKNEINHIDHNKTNNRLDNLEDISHSLNLKKAVESGKIKKEDRRCLNCGVEISYNSSLCLKCNAIVNRKCERPNRKELKNLIRTLPFTTIGQQFGVSDNTIRKWCLSEGLPSKKRDINNISEEDWLLL